MWHGVALCVLAQRHRGPGEDERVCAARVDVVKVPISIVGLERKTDGGGKGYIELRVPVVIDARETNHRAQCHVLEVGLGRARIPGQGILQTDIIAIDDTESRSRALEAAAAAKHRG